MSHYLDKLAFECEKHIVTSDDLAKLPGPFPPEVKKFIDLVTGDMNEFMKEYGGPTAVAKHPTHGWVMLGCGQGPFIMWAENTLPE
jgi:hypothetical protein